MSIDQTTTERNTREKSRNLRSLASFFMVCGFGGIAFGLLHFLGILSRGFTYIRLGDAIINTVCGVLSFVCYRLSSTGKLVVVWVFAFEILLSIVYSFAVGRGFNYIFAILGVLIGWQLFSLRKNGELA